MTFKEAGQLSIIHCKDAAELQRMGYCDLALREFSALAVLLRMKLKERKWCPDDYVENCTDMVRRKMAQVMSVEMREISLMVSGSEGKTMPSDIINNMAKLAQTTVAMLQLSALSSLVKAQAIMVMQKSTGRDLAVSRKK